MAATTENSMLENGPSPRRATTRLRPGSSSRGTASVVHSPIPSIATVPESADAIRDELLDPCVAGRIADRDQHGPVAHQADDLRLDVLGDADDRRSHRLRLVVDPGEQREQLGELLRGPAGARLRFAALAARPGRIRRFVHQPTASTTSVWLWKPATPWVRAISP